MNIKVTHKGRASKVNVKMIEESKKVEEMSDQYTEEEMAEEVKEVSIDHIVAELREVTDKDFKRIFQIAKQYRKADTMLNKYSPEMLLGESDND